MKRLALISLALPAILTAQGIRISGTTSVQFVELRQLVGDSALATTIAGTGEWRTTAEGVPALCPLTSAYCRFERSGARMNATPVLQNITFAGWGWTEGLSFHADLRARTQLGSSAFTWPRSGDHFDLLDAYAELERGEWRSRLGRQWVSGGLGAYDFDGADVNWRRDALSVEGWGGRALLAGMNDPYTSGQLAAVENIAPRQDGYILGARARFRPDALGAATLTYQRILVADRSGLYSERAAIDASTHRFGTQFDLGLAYDFATGDWNEARLRAATGGMGTLGTAVELRHSRPYFELWTIWGAFAPVAFDEVRGIIDWRPKALPVAFSVRGAFRKHEESNAGFELRTNGWRAGADVLWTHSDELNASASYDVDIGSGAASEDMRAGVRWIRPSGTMLAAEASVAQNIYEFRVGTGRIYGAMLSGALPIGPDVRLVLDAGLYQHALTNGAPGPDWTQRRAAMRLEWTLGRDPGTGAGKAP